MSDQVVDANLNLQQNITGDNFKRRSDIHWARKIWHMTTVFLMFVIYQMVPLPISKAILFAAFILFVPLDFIRLAKASLNDFIVHSFKAIIRSHEVHRLAGTTYLLTGAMILVFFFPPQIVSLTLLFLAFADPIASYFGIRFGKDKIFGQKTIQGFWAAFIACFICSLCFLLTTTLPGDRLIVFCLLAAFVGAIAELVPIGNLDDNLTLPVLSAVGLLILFYFFGFLENYGG